MMDENDLDASQLESLKGDHGGQNVRKNIALHLKTSAKPKKAKKPVRPKREEAIQPHNEPQGDSEEVQLSPMKGPSEPLHKTKRLKWKQRVNLVGRKHIDPHIHCCEKCKTPILIYGRVIPCKHVFCLDCANKADKKCLRCGDLVQRIEKATLGTVFICTHGGSKHGVSGCRRTYLSTRDLQAHVQYRHCRNEDGSARAIPSQTQTGNQSQTTKPQNNQPFAGPPQQFNAPVGQVSSTGPVFNAGQPGPGLDNFGGMNMLRPGPRGMMMHQRPSGGFNTSVPPPQMPQPPPNVNFPPPSGGMPARGFPNVSFSSNVPPPQHGGAPLQAPMGMMQRPGMPAGVVPGIVSSQPGLPPPPRPRFQNFNQGPWQGQMPGPGSAGPPLRF